jgi:hypothetical protein
MIRAQLSDGSLLFGIDAENVRRLTKQRKPIVIDLAQFGHNFRICIMYGETMAEIQQELERANGPLPPATPYIPGPGEPQ